MNFFCYGAIATLIAIPVYTFFSSILTSYTEYLCTKIAVKTQKEALALAKLEEDEEDEGNPMGFRVEK